MAKGGIIKKQSLAESVVEENRPEETQMKDSGPSSDVFMTNIDNMWDSAINESNMDTDEAHELLASKLKKDINQVDISGDKKKNMEKGIEKAEKKVFGDIVKSIRPTVGSYFAKHLQDDSQCFNEAIEIKAFLQRKKEHVCVDLIDGLLRIATRKVDLRQVNKKLQEGYEEIIDQKADADGNYHYQLTFKKDEKDNEVKPAVLAEQKLARQQAIQFSHQMQVIQSGIQKKHKKREDFLRSESEEKRKAQKKKMKKDAADAQEKKKNDAKQREKETHNRNNEELKFRKDWEDKHSKFKESKPLYKKKFADLNKSHKESKIQEIHNNMGRVTIKDIKEHEKHYQEMKSEVKHFTDLSKPVSQKTPFFNNKEMRDLDIVANSYMKPEVKKEDTQKRLNNVQLYNEKVKKQYKPAKGAESESVQPQLIKEQDEKEQRQKIELRQEKNSSLPPLYMETARLIGKKQLDKKLKEKYEKVFIFVYKNLANE